MAYSEGSSSDVIRAVAVLAAMVIQLIAGVLGGTGAWGETVGAVADRYPTPLLPGSQAFTIWLLIYVWMLALGIRQLFPGQHARAPHRRTGWWLAAAGLLNAAWILVFTRDWVAWSQVVIVALLGCLVVAFARLSALRAQGWTDRLLLHGPVALYTGWVSVAAVVGAATTGQAAGIDSSGRLGELLAVLALLLTGGIVLWVQRVGSALVPYDVAVAWALGWIAATAPSALVWGAALAAVAAVVICGAAARIRTAQDPGRAAWG